MAISFSRESSQPRHWTQISHIIGIFFTVWPPGKTQFSSVQFSHSVVTDFLWPHESQHTRPPCPSPTPRVYSNSRPLSREDSEACTKASNSMSQSSLLHPLTSTRLFILLGTSFLPFIVKCTSSQKATLICCLFPILRSHYHLTSEKTCFISSPGACFLKAEWLVWW